MSNQNLIFFRLKKVESENNFKLQEGLTLEVFKPSLFKLKAHKGNLLVYLFWYIFSHGNYKLFYVRNGEHKIVNYSHLIPKFFKFPFMATDDLHMGPSRTSPEYRGRGIHTYVKHYVLQKYQKKGRAFWAIVEENNSPSIRVQYKNGFVEVGRGYKSRYLGIYILNDSDIAKSL